MATIAFSTVGTMFGGPIGGAVGALVGRQFDAALFGGSSRQGARLKELDVTTSTYGQVIPRHFGRMRVAGSIIWATDLVEHSEVQGGGKGQPSVTTYSYAANFAVAVSSRPILGIGRIWADGKLLRGEAGDLKVGGTMRIHPGAGDAAPDPLIAASEGEADCPAFRDLAYVVFEELDLSEFYNRLPSLTFEVFADDAFSLQDIVGASVQDVEADVPLDGLAGYSCEGPPIDTLQTLDPFFPVDADAGETLTLGAAQRREGPIALPEPAIATGDGDFGAATGFSRSRATANERPIGALRYYDVARDYQPGVQHAAGRTASGQPLTIDLPAALEAGTARAFVERVARRADWSRDRISWRTAELDPRVAPGSLVTLPGRTGAWRVTAWEWRETGIELSLERQVPTGANAAPQTAVDPGRTVPPPDLALAETRIVAFELPWDGATTTGAASGVVFAAASSGGPNWSGAALYADHGDGALLPLGPSGRTRNVIGTALGVLPPASALLFDRSSQIVVELVSTDMTVSTASTRRLAMGANLALVGGELLQFGNAEPLGDGRWRLSMLLRGRGGTEAAIGTHAAGEPFVLLDGRALALDAGTVGSLEGTEIVAVGRGDPAPITSPILLHGIGRKPLSPVHPRVAEAEDDSLTLAWTRRARGGWEWRDGVDVPLAEETERYQVTFETAAGPVASWTTAEPSLTIPAATRSDLMGANGAFLVRQSGTHALSDPLFLCSLS